MAMLEVNNLNIQFGGLRAVNGFHVTIEKGQLYGLIGPNGAGKTTYLTFLQVYTSRQRELSIWTDRISQEKVLLRSIRQVLQELSRIFVFSKMSVLDNVKVGLHNHHKYSTLTGIYVLRNILR